MKNPTCKIVLTCLSTALLPVLLTAAPATSAPSDAGGGSVLMAFAVPVLAVVFAMLALWWLVRRYTVARGSSGPMRVTQALAVGPRERVVLVDAGDRHLVVGVTPAAVTLLTQWEKNDEQMPPSSAS